jgi:hypothetical protein
MISSGSYSFHFMTISPRQWPFFDLVVLMQKVLFLHRFCSFQVRGLDTDTAVLCTPTQTFSLQRAHTSNMLLPIAPIVESRLRSSDEDMDMDIGSNNSMDPFPQLEEDETMSGPRYERQAVLDILDNVLDLIPISPRLERLGQLLAQNPFEGWAQESHLKVEKQELRIKCFQGQSNLQPGT